MPNKSLFHIVKLDTNNFSLIATFLYKVKANNYKLKVLQRLTGSYKTQAKYKTIGKNFDLWPNCRIYAFKFKIFEKIEMVKQNICTSSTGPKAVNWDSNSRGFNNDFSVAKNKWKVFFSDWLV